MDAEYRRLAPECPTIVVALAPGVSEQAYRWAVVGAEEEGVPCSLMAEPEKAPSGSPGQQALQLAFAAARTSRLGVGLGIAGDQVVLQESHMPAESPVMSLVGGGEFLPTCRLAGGNAGRMVKRMPLRFSVAEILLSNLAAAPAPVQGPANASPTKPESPNGSPTELPQASVLADMVARILRERGLI